jgi:hypothetical protein
MGGPGVRLRKRPAAPSRVYVIGGLLIGVVVIVIAFVLWNLIERLNRKPKR